MFDQNCDIFLEILIYYNQLEFLQFIQKHLNSFIIGYELSFCQNFVTPKVQLKYISCVIIFLSIAKSLKTNTSEH